MINLPYNCLKIFLLILTNSLSLLKLVFENIKVFLFTSLIDLEMNTLKCVFNCIPITCSIKLKVLSYGHCTDFLSGWSTEGVRTVSTGGNETHCYTTHLTSFAVMLVSGHFCHVPPLLKRIHIVHKKTQNQRQQSKQSLVRKLII